MKGVGREKKGENMRKIVSLVRRNSRLVVTAAMVALAALGVAGAEPPASPSYTDYGDVVDLDVFADLGTYIFGVLVAAVVAGLGLLVARVGVRRVWTFIRSFF